MYWLSFQIWLFWISLGVDVSPTLKNRNTYAEPRGWLTGFTDEPKKDLESFAWVLRKTTRFVWSFRLWYIYIYIFIYIYIYNIYQEPKWGLIFWKVWPLKWWVCQPLQKKEVDRWVPTVNTDISFHVFFFTFFGSPKNPDIYPQKYIDFPYIPNDSGDSGFSNPYESYSKREVFGTILRVHMGVSLNGGTPKTPQNDHF